MFMISFSPLDNGMGLARHLQSHLLLPFGHWLILYPSPAHRWGWGEGCSVWLDRRTFSLSTFGFFFRCCRLKPRPGETNEPSDRFCWHGFIIFYQPSSFSQPILGWWDIIHFIILGSRGLLKPFLSCSGMLSLSSHSPSGCRFFGWIDAPDGFLGLIFNVWSVCLFQPSTRPLCFS